MLNTDKAGKKYWDQAWEGNEVTRFVDPREPGLDNYPNKCFHEYFSKLFAGLETQNLKLLELGCARSVWLPYFAKEFGFKVYGIDYSEIGCQQAREVLSDVGVEGKIICADFFTSPEYLLDYFDVVVSFGVVEHFQNTASCIAAFAKFLKPGGIMITNIPNLSGLTGLLQKLLNKPVFDIHVPLDVETLNKSHVLAGLEVLECNYFLSISLGIVNLIGLNPQKISTGLKDVIYHNLCRISKLVWAIEEHFLSLPETGLMSPYIMCTARKR
jgi:2-polyprenyl-3-methyl-5-hydroxy-6-metoxy-1,4-benzoquinol methylase